MRRARDNPFATEHVLRVRYRFLKGSLADLLVRLESSGFRGAIVGPEGSGKTTLLEDLVAPLEARGFRVHLWRLHRGSRRQSWMLCRSLRRARLGPGDLALLDGAEQLGPLAWFLARRATRRAGGLLITRHRPGGLPTLLSCRTSPGLLHDIVANLAGDTAAADGERARELFARHGGNLREALRELYDQWAHAPSSPDADF